MNRPELPSAPVGTRRHWSAPWARTRVTAAHLVRTETAVVDGQTLANLNRNPNVASIAPLRQVTSGRWAVRITWTDRNTPIRRKVRVPVRVEGGRRFAVTALAVLGVPVALFAATWGVWALVGSAVGRYGGAALLILSVVFLLWALSITTGRCPGLHCPGCGHK